MLPQLHSLQDVRYQGSVAGYHVDDPCWWPGAQVLHDLETAGLEAGGYIVDVDSLYIHCINDHFG